MNKGHDDAIAEIAAIREYDERKRAAEEARYAGRRRRALELLFYIQTHGVMTNNSLEQVILEIAAAEERGVT